MLLRQTVIYSLGSLIPGIIAMGLVALYTRALSPEEFGLYALVITSIEFGWSLSLSWLTTAIVRLYPTQENKSQFLGAILTIFLWVVGTAALLLLASLAFLDDPRHRYIALLGLFLFAATSWMELNTGLFSAQLDARRSTITRIVRSVGSGLFAAAFVLTGAGAEGILAGAAIGMLLPGIAQIFRDWRHAEGIGRASNLGQLATIGRPLAGGIAVGSVGAYAGRFIVTAIEGIHALGLYTIAAELAERLVMAIFGPLSMAAGPLATHDLEEFGVEAARDRLTKAFVLMTAIMVPATAGITLVTPDIVSVLIGGKFQEVTLILLPLATLATMLFSFRAGYLDQAIHLGMKQHYLFWREVIYLFVTIASSLVFISLYGVIGLGIGAVFTTSVMLLITFFFARKAFPLPFPLTDLGKVVLATGGMCLVLMAVPVEAGLIGLFIKPAIGVVTYCALLLALDVSSARALLMTVVKERFAFSNS